MREEERIYVEMEEKRGEYFHRVCLNDVIGREINNNDIEYPPFGIMIRANEKSVNDTLNVDYNIMINRYALEPQDGKNTYSSVFSICDKAFEINVKLSEDKKEFTYVVLRKWFSNLYFEEMKAPNVIIDGDNLKYEVCIEMKDKF